MANSPFFYLMVAIYFFFLINEIQTFIHLTSHLLKAMILKIWNNYHLNCYFLSCYTINEICQFENVS